MTDKQTSQSKCSRHKVGGAKHVHAWITWPWRVILLESELSRSNSPVYVQVCLWFCIYYTFILYIFCVFLTQKAVIVAF